MGRNGEPTGHSRCDCIAVVSGRMPKTAFRRGHPPIRARIVTPERLAGLFDSAILAQLRRYARDTTRSPPAGFLCVVERRLRAMGQCERRS